MSQLLGWVLFMMLPWAGKIALGSLLAALWAIHYWQAKRLVEQIERRRRERQGKLSDGMYVEEDEVHFSKHLP